MKTVIDAVNEFKGDFDNTEINGFEEDQDQVLMANKAFDQFDQYDLSNGSNNTSNEYWTVICTLDEFNQCVDEMSKAEWIKPVTLSPIYTQEMADNGELPLVGMECMINDSIHDDKYYKSVISFVGTSNIIWTHGGAEYSQSTSPLTFKPITLPIELLNGEFYGFDYNNDSYRGIYSKREDRFIFADGHVMAISCKNIQPLTVEVK